MNAVPSAVSFPSKTNNSLNTTFFANGLRLITRNIPGIRSTALGIWLVNGVRHQCLATNGYAHLLEHLLFKGAGTRDTLALAQRFDSWGGQINAQTGRELTAFYGLVPGFHVVELLEQFSDMLLAPRFTDSDVAAERAVVLQEMTACEASAEDAMMEYAVNRAWPGQAIGWPILGDKQVIAAANGESLQSYLAGLLQGNRLLVVASGAVNHEHLQRACRALAQLPRGDQPSIAKPTFTATRRIEHWRHEQAYCCWLMPVPSPRSALYPAVLLANHLLGGGMVSRLYQRLRETLGLSYEIMARLEFYSDTGLWQLGMSCEPARAKQCHRLVERIVRRLLSEGPTAAELAGARQHLLANLYIEEDNPLQVMERLARETLYLGRNPSVREYQLWLSNVTAEQVKEVLRMAWRQVMHIVWTPDAGVDAFKNPAPGFPSILR